MNERRRKLRPRPRATKGETKLARARLSARLTQQQMSEMTGLSLATYRRLERGSVRNPQLRHLSNCAIVLNLRLIDILDDQWLEWTPFDRSTAAEPPLRARGRRTAA